MKIKTNFGFTLIELMMTVVVVGILTVIASSTYQSYLVSSNRSAAQATLMDLAQRQQQYLIDTRGYAASISTLNTSVPANVSQYYTLQIATTSGPPPTFTITATPITTSIQSSDGALTIDQAGNKTPSSKW